VAIGGLGFDGGAVVVPGDGVAEAEAEADAEGETDTEGDWSALGAASSAPHPATAESRPAPANRTAMRSFIVTSLSTHPGQVGFPGSRASPAGHTTAPGE